MRTVRTDDSSRMASSLEDAVRMVRKERSAYQVIIPRQALAAQLDDCVARGHELTRQSIVTSEDYLAAEADFDSWDQGNAALLRRSYDTATVQRAYRGLGSALRWHQINFGDSGAVAPVVVAGMRNQVQVRMRFLEGLRSELDFDVDRAADEPAPTSIVLPDDDRTIFIVHGHDHLPAQLVSGFLRDVTRLRPVILHAQPNQGRAIIEKFEDNAADAAFAVVLLTGDDEGGPRGLTDWRHRARQNVVFELGFFIALLGRSRVCILYEPGVELPSDIHGIVYTELDRLGGWRLELARELRAAGLPVDANRAF